MTARPSTVHLNPSAGVRIVHPDGTGAGALEVMGGAAVYTTVEVSLTGATGRRVLLALTAQEAASLGRRLTAYAELIRRHS